MNGPRTKPTGTYVARIAGPLQIARHTKPFALLVGQRAYEGKGGAGPGVPVRTVRGVNAMSELTAWDSFYVIVGLAAGALIGLQFVVMTLIAQRPDGGAAGAGAAFCDADDRSFRGRSALYRRCHALYGQRSPRRSLLPPPWHEAPAHRDKFGTAAGGRPYDVDRVRRRDVVVCL